MDLCAPLDLTTDPDKAAESLERVRVALLGRAEDIQDTRHRVDSMVREYNITQGFMSTGDGPSWAGQVWQRGRVLGMELDRMAAPMKLPPIIAKPTYSSPSKNLQAACYITIELVGL
jgi:hypothetical protein